MLCINAQKAETLEKYIEVCGSIGEKLNKNAFDGSMGLKKQNKTATWEDFREKILARSIPVKTLLTLLILPKLICGNLNKKARVLIHLKAE